MNKWRMKLEEAIREAENRYPIYVKDIYENGILIHKKTCPIDVRTLTELRRRFIEKYAK